MKNIIKNSLNNIIPDNSQKQRMLQNILKPKRKSGVVIFTCAVVFSCLIFTFILFQKEDNSTNILEPSINRINLYQTETIEFNNECYELKENIDGNEKIDKLIGQYDEYKVYEISQKSIALVKDDIIKIYIQCERK